MAEDLISEYVDREGIRQDTEFMLGELNKAKQAFDKLNNVNVSLGGVKGVKELEAATKLANEANRECEATVKRLTNAQKALTDVEAKQARVKTENARAAKAEGQAAEANAKAQMAEAKATAENEKAKLAEAKASEFVLKQKERLSKQTDAEIKKQEKLGSAYAQLNARYKVQAQIAQEMGAKYGSSSKEFEQAAARASKLHDELLKIDSAIGKSQRNVGNYSQAQFALSQVLRETPAFANSVATGFLGISNNIPILVDQYKALKEQTGSNTQALGILGKSLFSTTNLITLGIAAITYSSLCS